MRLYVRSRRQISRCSTRCVRTASRDARRPIGSTRRPSSSHTVDARKVPYGAFLHLVASSQVYILQMNKRTVTLSIRGLMVERLLSTRQLSPGTEVRLIESHWSGCQVIHGGQIDVVVSLDYPTLINFGNIIYCLDGPPAKTETPVKFKTGFVIIPKRKLTPHGVLDRLAAI
jgi:hypothetical protein